MVDCNVGRMVSPTEGNLDPVASMLGAGHLSTYTH